MNFVEDPSVQQQLFPFTLTRAVADILIGILTIRQKWMLASAGETLNIPSNLLPCPEALTSLRAGNTVTAGGGKIFINYPWHIFQYNDQAIRQDYLLLTKGRVSQPPSKTNQILSPENVFVEEGARVEYCLLNASTGPIYIGKNAEVMEGCNIRGSFALCEGGIVKMGTNIYGATTVGPYSVAAGEIKNSVIFGYSNKGHHGYLGDSVIGEWCNLGAGTSNSNVKNSAGDIKIWNPITRSATSAGNKCGLLMGDFCRSAINTSFNTGTVTGVCCNIFGEGLTGLYIPSFTWGVKEPARYKFDKALEHIANWKKLKKHSLGDAEIKNLKHIFDNY